MAAEYDWCLVLGSVLLCNLVKVLLLSVSSVNDAELEMEMRTEIQDMKKELSSISMMDEFDLRTHDGFQYLGSHQEMSVID